MSNKMVSQMINIIVDVDDIHCPHTEVFSEPNNLCILFNRVLGRCSAFIKDDLLEYDVEYKAYKRCKECIATAKAVTAKSSI